MIWHSRLGHSANQALNCSKDLLKFGNEFIPPCEVYHKAKQTREFVPLSEHKTKCLGELIHVDVWVPYKFVAFWGFRFFLTVVANFSRAT